MRTGARVGMVLAGFAAAGSSLVLLPVLMVMGGSGVSAGSSGEPSGCVASTPEGSPVRLTDADQRENAKTIIRVAVSLHVPRQGLVDAIAAAMQESKLHNLPGGDRDSVGLFQQRGGWGSTAERMDPAEATRMFLTGGHGGQPGLLDIDGWQGMSIADAVQAVQRSGFPLAYQQWAGLAETTVAQVLAGSDTSACASDDPIPGVPGGAVGAMVTFALAQQGKPYVWGAVGPDAWDCSGLVVGSWRAAGYRLTIRTAAQMYRSSTHVDVGSERPGDLAFSEVDSGGAGHVEIVVHPGMLVEAPHTGDVVKLDTYRRGLRFGRLKTSVMVAVG